MQSHTPSKLGVLLAWVLPALLCLVLWGALLRGQSGPIALVQHTGKDAGTTTSSSLAFTANNTAGNWIAVVIRAGRTGQAFTLTDTRGNTYRRAVQYNETVDATTLGIFYAENIVAGANTITVSHTFSDTLRFAILEYSGVAAANSLDATATGQGTSNAPTTGTASTTTSGDLVIGVLSTANPRTFTAGIGSVIQERVAAAPNTKLVVEDRVQTTAGPVSVNGTLNTSDIWGAALAAFRPAGGGSTAPSITSVNPASGMVGTSVTIAGTNFGATRGTSTVTFNGTAATPTSWGATSVIAPVPTGATTGPVVVTVNGVPSNGATFTVTPSGDTLPPTAPGNLTATAVSGSQINVNWAASTDNIGVAGYRVEQCQGAGCTNFTEIGQVTTAPAGLGPLVVSANPNYFQDASGTPLILNGSHTWNNLQDWGTNGSLRTLDFNAFVNTLVTHGHNFTYLWYIELPKFCGFPTTSGTPPDFNVGPHPWQRTGPGNATDGAPKFDLTKYNQAYFDRLRTRVEALNNAGIYVGVYTFTAEWVGRYRCATDGYPFTGVNNINGINDGGGSNSFTMSAPNAITAVQDAYVEKVIDTLNDFPNVLWMVSEEAPVNSEWWNDHQIAHIRSYESGKPNRHPIGYATPEEFTTGDAIITNSDADWISPSVNVSPTTSCGSGTPRCKVNVNDSDHSNFGMWNSSAQQNRNYAWMNFTNGNQVAFMDPYVLSYTRENRNLCVSPINGICSGPDTRWSTFRNNLGYILRYSRKLNLANVVPRGSLCSTGNCLAQTPSVGAEYLIYAPNGGSFTVNLSAMSSARTLNVEWFNPSTGVTTIASPIPAGASSRSFAPPFSGDAVLYLVDSAGHAGAAVAPQTSYTVTGLGPGTYRYQVRAIDAAGNTSAYSNVAGATIQTPDTTPPTAPSGLTATAAGAGQIDLGWTASTDDVGVTGYLVERCQGAGCASFAQVAAPAGTGTTFTNSGLTASTSYMYRVRAIDAASNPGPYSNTATATTLQAPAGITLVQHTNKDAGTATSSSLAFTSSNTAGNWVAVAIRAWPTAPTLTVTDAGGNTYRKAVQLNETVDGMTVGIFYAENIAGGSNTVTVSGIQPGGTLRFAILEYSGVATAGSLDATAASQGTSTAPTSGSSTTTSSGDLVIGVISTANGRTYTESTGYVIEDRVPAAPSTKLIVEDRRQATAGPVLAGASLNSSDTWGAVLAAFRVGASGPPPSSPSSELMLTKADAGSFPTGQSGASSAVTAPGAYAVTDLGTLGGTSAQAYDINEAGEVVGWATTAASQGRAFLWQNGGMTDLGASGGTQADAQAINNAGQIAGRATTTFNSPLHAVLWNNGVITDLIPGSPGSSTANGINDVGQIVGTTTNGSAFLWQNGVLTNLGHLGGGGGFGAGLNDAGHAVGSSYTTHVTELGPLRHAFLWQGGVMTDLGVLPGDDESWAWAINNVGQIVGSSGHTDPRTYEVTSRAFLYDAGVMTALPVPNWESYAGGINDSGVVVGTMRAAGDFSSYHAYIYADGVVTNLNTLIPSDSGLHLASATGINNAGQIVGVAIDSRGDQRAFLLVPAGQGTRYQGP